tara:strand:- start:3475 stop:4347 length:873 start_codon:yes stop_codon:yes gene_type:complete
MKILVLGVNGLIGSSIFRILTQTTDHLVQGTVRNSAHKLSFSKKLHANIITDIDVLHDSILSDSLLKYKPDAVINCAGLTKHRPGAEDPLISLPINSLFPHKLSRLCAKNNTRVIHISTDCVFSGDKGFYYENDYPDSKELYGISKFLGEVDYNNAITLRTSTIGHENQTNAGLLEWFLSQENSCKGFNKAIFSGIPTIILAQIIRDYILEDKSLTGLYNIAAKPIDKFSLLEMIAKVYNKKIRIDLDDSLVIDRSLCSEKFTKATGFVAPSWNDMLLKMYNDNKEVSNV